MKKILLKMFLVSVMSIFTLSASAQDYLCFTAEEAGSTVALNKKNTPTEVTLQTCTDGTNWSDYTIGTEISLTNKGDKVYFRNKETTLSFSKISAIYYYFSMTGKIAASGNVMSLVDKSCTTKEVPCNHCFSHLFYNCSSLTAAPELPATTLAESCYSYMFCGCTSLTTAPELPATTLAKSCYSYMFQSCTSLTSAPELPATTLVKNCYISMFDVCEDLNNIKASFTDWNTSDGATTNWVKGVVKTGTFTCTPNLDTFLTGSDKVPSSWAVSRTFDLNVSSVGWASFCANLPLQVPEGVEVYYASNVDGSTITLTQIPVGTTMAPLTAVLVKAPEGKVSFPVMGEDGTAFSDNLFKGTSVEKPRKEEVYTLTGVGSTGNPQFQNYVGETLGAHKAYLPKSAVSSYAKELTFVFEEPTGINNVSLDINANSATYNLNGLRVSEGYKGIVIKNGKRFINK